MRLRSPKASRWFAALSGTSFRGDGVKRSNPSDGRCFRQESFSGDSDLCPSALLWKPLPLLKNLPYSQILQTPFPFETVSSLNEHRDFIVFLRADVLEHAMCARCTEKCTRKCTSICESSRSTFFHFFPATKDLHLTSSLVVIHTLRRCFGIKRPGRRMMPFCFGLFA